MSGRCGPARIRGLFLPVAACLALAGCRGAHEMDEESSLPPLRRPKARLDRETEKKVMELIEQMRGDEYLGRVKARDDLEKLIRNAEECQAATFAGYIIQLAADSRLEVRVTALKFLMAYGRDCRQAVAALVEVLGDARVNPGVRDGAARALSRWTGRSFGYSAWDDEIEVAASAALWRKWLGETGGVIVP